MRMCRYAVDPNSSGARRQLSYNKNFAHYTAHMSTVELERTSDLTADHYITRNLLDFK